MNTVSTVPQQRDIAHCASTALMAAPTTDVRQTADDTPPSAHLAQERDFAVKNDVGLDRCNLLVRTIN